MKLRTIELVVLYQKLEELGSRESLSLPVRISFKFLRNGKIIEPIVTSFLSARDQAIMRVAEPVEGQPDQVCVSKEDFSIINKEVEALGNEEIEVNLVPVKLSELESLDLTMQDLAGLYPIIENEEA